MLLAEGRAMSAHEAVRFAIGPGEPPGDAVIRAIPAQARRRRTAPAPRRPR